MVNIMEVLGLGSYWAPNSVNRNMQSFSRHPPAPPPALARADCAKLNLLTGEGLGCLVCCRTPARIINGHRSLCLCAAAWNEDYPRVREDFTITQKASTRALSWLKVPSGTFTFMTLLRLYDGWMDVDPMVSIDMKFGHWWKSLNCL